MSLPLSISLTKVSRIISQIDFTDSNEYMNQCYFNTTIHCSIIYIVLYPIFKKERIIDITKKEFKKKILDHVNNNILSINSY